MTMSFLRFSAGGDLSNTDVSCILGGFGLGLAPANVPWPMQSLGVPVHGETTQGWQEGWVADRAVASGVQDGIRWRRHEGLLFGLIELAEASPRVIGGLEALTNDAYHRLFRLLDEQGLPHLWRVWNYMAEIHGDAETLERYRQFNRGRARAFEQAARSVTGQVPAACALGVARGPLSIAFLAGAVPVQPVENPRHISAWRYPAQYGPQSPTFSRAVLARPPGQEWLMISGTASIVGHETVHRGDVLAQTRETLANIEAVVAQANRLAQAGPFTLPELSYRAYVRQLEDMPEVSRWLAHALGGASVVCVQADVCREDLLVEVEAMGWHPLA